MKRITALCLGLCFAAVAAAAASPALAQNWPSFRGANASGVSTGAKMPVTWDVDKSNNVVWKTALPGLSHASPVVWGDRVFVITAVSSNANATFQAKNRGIGLAADDVKHAWRIYCLDKNSGRVLWERTAYEGVPRARRHVKASQANSTPATDGRYVVALFGSEGLNGYDMNGNLLWKRDLGILNPGLADDPSSEWGHSSSPIIYKDLAIVQCDGHKQSFIAAYSLKDGKRVWYVPRRELPSWSTPTVYEGAGRAELISNAGRYIRGYDPLTGRELWRFSDKNTEVKMPAPVVAHGMIYVTGGYPPGRPIYAFRPGATGDISLTEGETSNRHLAWHASRGSSYTGTPLVYGEHLYILADNGVLTAYNARTGERLYQERLPSSFSASPIAGDGKLYLASEDGDVYVVRAGPAFELLATNRIGEALMATPAISGGMIIIRAQNHLFGIAERAAARPSAALRPQSGR